VLLWQKTLHLIGSVIDEICLVRSMTTEAINHDPAHMFMNTGSQIAGRPSMGSWVVYGLGSESEDLPGVESVDLKNTTMTSEWTTNVPFVRITAPSKTALFS